MNRARGHCRRLFLLSLAFCFSGLSVLADLAPAAEQQRKELGVFIAKVDQHRSRLTGSEEGNRRLAALDRSLATIRSCLDRLPVLAAELEAQDTRLRDLQRLELEPKRREVEQIRQTQEMRFSALLAEKQVLETETFQHNNRPHIFYDSQLAERARYIAEATALEARWQRLQEAATVIRAEVQPRLENADRALAKAQQDFSEATARRDNAARLLQEQNFLCTSTRGALAEQLDQLDHEAAASVSP